MLRSTRRRLLSRLTAWALALPAALLLLAVYYVALGAWELLLPGLVLVALACQVLEWRRSRRPVEPLLRRFERRLARNIRLARTRHQ